MKFTAAKIEVAVAGLVMAGWVSVVIGFLFLLQPMLHAAAHASGREHKHGPSVPNAPHGANSFEHGPIAFFAPAVAFTLLVARSRLILIIKKVYVGVPLMRALFVAMPQGP
jgi:hypothetical protein